MPELGLEVQNTVYKAGCFSDSQPTTLSMPPYIKNREVFTLTAVI